MLSNAINNQSASDFLSTKEEEEIDKRVDGEIARILANMAFLGGAATIISGLFFLWIIYEWANYQVMLGWYSMILILNLANIFLNYYFKDRLTTVEARNIWRPVLLVLFSLICLTWGSIPILFQSNNANYDLAIVGFLLAVVIGFSFPSISDFTLALISITGLLLPSIIFYLYRLIFAMNSGQDPSIHIAVSSSIFILSLFLLGVTRISSRLVRRFFQLSFSNVVLTQKLQHINKFLEERVKERTIELERTLQTVTYQATHDLLTDLPNQRSLVHYIKTVIEQANHDKYMFAIVFFSINEIDRIYNALGYQGGDYVIKTIAQRFQEVYGNPTEDNFNELNYVVTLTRNDVFAILIKPISSIEKLEEKIRSLFAIVEKAVFTENQLIKLTASIGVCVYPRNGRNISSLLMNADAAMVLAKQSGGNNLQMYKSEINAAISKQLEIESKLHEALIQSEFIIQYQPLVSIKSGRIVGAEALVRWENPTLGRIPPDSFIPLAEANGIIIPLGEWVFRTACKANKNWQEMGYDIIIAVNLSAKQLKHSIIKILPKILNELNLERESVELELTETAAFKHEAIPILKELKSMGFSLSIDDFGTGFSGLANIKLFAPDKIKIDKSFVQDITTNNDSQAIVKNTIVLAQSVNAKVVAEGVETKEQLAFLIDHGCDFAQGYYFSPPVDEKVLTELLKSDINFLNEKHPL